MSNIAVKTLPGGGVPAGDVGGVEPVRAANRRVKNVPAVIASYDNVINAAFDLKSGLDRTRIGRSIRAGFSTSAAVASTVLYVQ